MEKQKSLGEQLGFYFETMLKMYSTAENSAEKKALKSKIHSMAGELPIEPEMFTEVAVLIGTIDEEIAAGCRKSIHLKS
ncbi:hypothetical protein CRE_03366 [Caenorhabditis remanei]|uniref:Uncharacterized protein n=1 Tax=Caenorhabditis remanei TaxID=31234 RepID=E3N662_CAERE|nr:hypothetical protein CRE_03366 [Caenorhabditis remanei]